MPTGYTADVKNGKITRFDEFALRCARAFGATILMRDDPMDAEIPEAFEASRYYEEELAKRRALLIKLENLSPEDAETESRAEHQAAIAAWEERKQRKAVERHRYEAMLEHVRAWTPPSSDHIEMKKFMESQLVESIDFDCSMKYDDPPKFVIGDEWRAQHIAEARKQIDYYIAERKKEIERTDGRNRWLRQLRDSLKESQ